MEVGGAGLDAQGETIPVFRNCTNPGHRREGSLEPYDAMGFTAGRLQFVISDTVDHHSVFHGGAIAKIASPLTDDVEIAIKAVAITVHADISEIQVGNRRGKCQGPGARRIERDYV